MATSQEADAFGSGHGEVQAGGPAIQSTAPGAPSATPSQPKPTMRAPYQDTSNGESSSDASTRAAAAHAPYDYGGNPLAKEYSHMSQMMGPNAAFLQPGMFKEVDSKKANGAPLGLSGFALTTFVLSMVNLHVKGVTTPNVFVGVAIAYGGLIQLLAGMWEMALGNTFAAWALSSYGGWWIGLGIIFIPGGFEIAEQYGGETVSFFNVLGFYIYGWMIFTIFVWLATLRATLIFNLLLLCVWLAFLCLATGYIDNTGGDMPEPNYGLQVAGGAFGIVAAFLAWWVMLAGCLVKDQNSWIEIPTFHFPWSPEGREKRGKPRDLEKFSSE